MEVLAIKLSNETLVDISTINIDLNKPMNERIEAFIKQVKDPYRFRVGDIPVSIQYENTQDTLQSRLSKMLSN